MKRLSQTWQQKKSGRGQENVPPGVSREKDGSGELNIALVIQTTISSGCQTLERVDKNL